MAAVRAPAFRGRAHECAQLEQALGRARAGESAVLVIRGEAGIGKTALLRYCAQHASGCRVAQIAGAEPELKMPFASLHQLCRPMLDRLDALPEPQKRALQVAFGMSDGTSPDRFIVGLAVLSLLAEVAADRPLVCLIDDAQWLDEPSLQVLGFVGRRLLAEAVLLVFAAREEGDDRCLPSLPELHLRGLADEDARSLLSDAIAGKLDEQVRDRIVSETRGNPLGLVELPKGMSRAELAGGFAFANPTSLSGQLHDHYVRRVRALPASTQRLMALAAADPTGDATAFWRAAQMLDLRREAAAAAEMEQLLEIASRVRFRHPLVRAAAYAAATVADRRAAHLALAAATEEASDSERRVWHRAAAATGPDEAVASELVGAAGTARTRAGLAAAAAFLQRAVELTASPAMLANRALAAAEANVQAGAFDTARRLLAEAGGAAIDDLQRAQVEQLNGQVEAAAGPGRDAPARLLQAARRLESLDERRARETYLQAWWAALLAGRFAPPDQLTEISRAARALPRQAEPMPCDLLLDGLATLITEGRTAARPVLRQAINCFVEDQVSDDDWIQWGRSATTAAFALWDFKSWIELSIRQVERARASGALTSLVLSLNFHANMRAYCGDLEGATRVVAEQEAAREATGIRMASYGARLVAAHQGHLAEMSAQTAAVEAELMKSADGYALQVATLATALLNNGLGRYADAVAAGQEMSAEFTFLGPLTLSEVIEAAVKLGRADVADEAFQRLLPTIVPDSDWAAGIEARGRALTSDDGTAEPWYLESISRLTRTPLRPDLARSRLLYGEWLRRRNRRLDAREQLRTAYEAFVEMGNMAFAERARRELLATGERVRKRVDDTRNDLTPQEQHVARLARDGRTNPEIATELFISARTVEWHLRKVFGKLGIASRRELKDVLAPTAGSPA